MITQATFGHTSARSARQSSGGHGGSGGSSARARAAQERQQLCACPQRPPAAALAPSGRDLTQHPFWGAAASGVGRRHPPHTSTSAAAPWLATHTFWLLRPRGQRPGDTGLYRSWQRKPQTGALGRGAGGARCHTQPQWPSTRGACRRGCWRASGVHAEASLRVGKCGWRPAAGAKLPCASVCWAGCPRCGRPARVHVLDTAGGRSQGLPARSVIQHILGMCVVWPRECSAGSFPSA